MTMSGIGGFSTAGGKSVTISADSMAKAQTMFSALDDIGGGGGGFSTASGKTVAISGDSIAKAKSIFSGVEDSLDDDEFGFFAALKGAKGTVGGFSTAARKSIAISGDSMAKAKSIFSDLDDIGGDGGFSTASGKTVAISGDSMAKAKSIFSGVEDQASTPKLPVVSKFANGRRRLADAPPPSTTFEKKKRMSIFNRINDDDGQEKNLSSTIPGSASPVSLFVLPKRRTFFQYDTQNGRRKSTTPVLFSTPSSSSPRKRIVYPNSTPRTIRNEIKTFKSCGKIEFGRNENRKTEFGKLYQLRKEASGKRMESELAGQTPRTYDVEEYERYGVKKSTLEVNSQNAATFEFTKDFFVDGASQMTLGDGVVLTRNDSGSVSADDFIKAFMNSSIVDSSLISQAWCQNHYRWIIWKEASMELAFPHLFGGSLLTPDRIMLQLKYRYDREIEKAERPALKRILNGDDTTYRPMVLCVSAILLNKEIDALIEVTDGWYCVRARLDRPLSERLVKGQIFVGQKLFISRCSIIGFEGGCEPLEIPASVQLTLAANNVRRAKWNSMLGFQRSKRLPCFSLTSLVVGGGMTAGVEVLIQHIHPVLYMSKNSSGRTILLDEKAEAKEARAFQEYYERCLEKLVGEIEAKFTSNGYGSADEEADIGKTGKDGSKLIPKTQEIHATGDVEELYRMYINAADPGAVAARATPTQKERLKAFCDKRNEKQVCKLRQKFENAICEKATVLPQRKVTPLVKMRVAGCHAKDLAQNVAPMLTIWRPDDDMLYHVKEGATYLVTNVQVSQSSGSWDPCKFALSTTAETRFIPLIKKK